MIPEALIIHSVPGRLRIKIPGMRHVDSYFAALDEMMQKIPGVTGVQNNPLVSSLLVTYDPPLTPEIIARYALDHELFELQPHHSWGSVALSWAREGAIRTHRKLRTADGERYDKRTLMLLVLIALGIRQARRGEIMVPAANLFWNAYTLLESMGEKSVSTADGEADAGASAD